MRHGHQNAEERNLALHRVALHKLRERPVEGKRKALELLDRWSAMPHLRRQLPLLEEWRRVLELPADQMERRILSEESQGLRQCSPLGALVSPQERFAVYRELLRR